MTRSNWYRYGNNFGRKLEWTECEVCGEADTIKHSGEPAICLSCKAKAKS